MPDAELLDVEERKEKIRKFITDLSGRFSELLWNDKPKTARLARLKPSVAKEFWERWDELNKRCREYLDGKIEWAGGSMQMEFTSTGQSYPRLVVDRDVENYGRDLFVWTVAQTKDL